MLIPYECMHSTYIFKLDSSYTSIFKHAFYFFSPLNPLGSRPEIMQTVVWIQTHLEEDVEISLPKQEVYEEYL